LERSAAALWVVAFATCLPAIVTGQSFARHLGLVSGPSPIPPAQVLGGLLREHVLWGLAATALLAACAWGGVRLLRDKPWSPRWQGVLGLGAVLAVAATGHHGGEMVYGAAPDAVPGADAGIVERVSDYRKTLHRVSRSAWLSPTHGRRFVQTYVSKGAVAAYREGEPLPPGTLVVKDSYEGTPDGPAGPLYIMEKGPKGSAPGTGDWSYALVWDEPTPGNPEGLSAPVTWRPGDPGLSSCIKCHARFKALDYMGGVPEEMLETR
jgi:hypothetical protein